MKLQMRLWMKLRRADELVMDETNISGRIEGALEAPSSKSMMIRAVAAALLSNGKSIILCPSYCDDALAAMECAKALGLK